MTVPGSVTVTAIVVAYNSSAHLASCLAALLAATDGPLEILVVDNASPDDTAAAVLATGVAARVIRMPRNAGFAVACNAGAREATGDYICFVNPDARVAPGAFDALLDASRRRPDHLLYSGRVETPDGHLDAGCCSALPSLWEYTCFATGLSTAFPRSRLFDPRALGDWDRTDERVVPAISGAFLLARRESFAEIGGFDEGYFMYSEDVDLSLRATTAMRPPLFVPSAVAIHDGGGSSTSGAKARMVLTGKVTFMLKHWPPARRRVGIGLLLTGVGVRALGARITGRGQQWREAWAHRSDWRLGWRLDEPATRPAGSGL
ncbi:MAG: N-acetylglucosaminyl-diphospho-decaprenol L-rhamnosyltransferase [Frankiaceae bacterium]|nr:N-acetylglucosaminyl-diphospho-decaprenol L-rhamnosyltransferase [Frankiaceae bacterium]